MGNTRMGDAEGSHDWEPNEWGHNFGMETEEQDVSNHEPPQLNISGSDVSNVPLVLILDS
jgi:hypothetical protein